MTTGADTSTDPSHERLAELLDQRRSVAAFVEQLLGMLRHVLGRDARYAGNVMRRLDEAEAAWRAWRAEEGL